jgi:hypothetical protein
MRAGAEKSAGAGQDPHSLPAIDALSLARQRAGIDINVAELRHIIFLGSVNESAIS